MDIKSAETKEYAEYSIQNASEWYENCFKSIPRELKISFMEFLSVNNNINEKSYSIKMEKFQRFMNINQSFNNAVNLALHSIEEVGRKAKDEKKKKYIIKNLMLTHASEFRNEINKKLYHIKFPAI